MKKIIFLLLLTLLSACSSLVKKGDKLYESGLYSEAASFYLRALERDADDVDAKLGLNRARYKIIDRGLIEVRMMRLSSNHSAAADKLEQILRDESRWSIVLDGAITSTQAEEIRYASYWLSQEAQRLADTAYPDQYRWFTYRYSQLIANGQLTDKFSVYRELIWPKGQQKCLSLAKGIRGQQFFLKAFTQKYCEAWNQGVSLKADTQDISRYKQLSPRISISQNLRGSQSQLGTINGSVDALGEQFRSSLWYSSMGSRALDVGVEGAISYRHSKQRKRREASYTTERVTVKKDKNGNDVSETVEVARSHSYYVYEHRETLKLSLKYSSEIGNNALARSINRPINKTSVEHDEYFPAANLSPQRPDLMNVTAIVAEEANHLNDSFVEALNQYWVIIYCQQGGNSSASSERAMRCAAAKPDDSYVNTWAVQNWGIDYQQLAELYALNRASSTF